ncbi:MULTISPECIES: transcription elongation factor GreB [unclassified Saccharibacter]|uniref:transcription elongation factor GreB n=1 Tax=unclassified Saccharibacter TaxID=2648722 RepID=UPI00132069F7|nr:MULTISPECIES: transcription elongation factor GreB [unclassified Saccharibacter]MXV36179.1 transcription elongation factor GreB [Saccharibacter sp. EH611]MXV57038.1 transcription elongation factor GreB [Saccharibacter sp. EH70]MXV66602.1 transcription elongation factor GreB [Saccharibacter sp. EH60]
MVTEKIALNRYLSPYGAALMRRELRELAQEERPKVVEVVSWAASNGDRSENADYHYGKRRLREIDRRIRFLTRRLDQAVIVDPAAQKNRDRVFFGATVCYADEEDREYKVTILGADEADLARGEVSLISPVARALMRARVEDEVTLHTPSGPMIIEVLSISYPQSP